MSENPGGSARTLDEEGRIDEAAAAYDDALQAGQLSRQDVVNYAFLLGLMCDYGFATHHRIPPGLARLAYRRFTVLVEWARQEFGEWGDLEFVQLYVPWAFLGIGEDAVVEAQMRQMLSEGTSLLPVLFLCSRADPSRHSEERDLLLSQIATEKTSKAEFIRSVLACSHVGSEPPP